jgi:hypothetical protein
MVTQICGSEKDDDASPGFSYNCLYNLTTLTLILKIEAALLSELLKSMYDTRWCYNSEDHNLNTFHHENLQTYNVYLRAIIFPQRFIIFDTNPQTPLEINFACKKFNRTRLKLINSWKAQQDAVALCALPMNMTVALLTD